LQHGDRVLFETLAICVYLDEAFEGPPLQPATPAGRAQMLKWIGVVNAYVFPVMNRFMKERLVRPAWGFAPDRAFIASAVLSMAWDLFTFVTPIHGTRAGLSASTIGLILGAFGAAIFVVRLLLPLIV
ncbi:MAG TPA: hypothetical protein PKA17_00360, partial [Phenylobacterium sp.]|nr:hypothetical protein [Phenylobacterium sp.]